jgi:hypothetical protein
MNFNIEQIVIMVDSNIPGMEPFELTNKTFHHPELKSAQMHAFSKHPYFITERKYPKDKLYILARMSYKKIVRFFFDKKYFETKLIGFFKQVDAQEKEKEKTEEKTDEENKKEKEDKRKKFDDIASHNVKIMIELLFPTTWPAVRNISDSHSEYILGKKDQGISFKDTVNQKVNFGFATKGTDITSGLFSYLKVDSKIYTISRVIWLNDLLNHPVYRKFIDNFINYSLWIERERDRMEILLDSKKKKLFGRIIDDGAVGANGNKKPHIDSLNIFEEEDNFIDNRIIANQVKIDERKVWHKEMIDLYKGVLGIGKVELPYDLKGKLLDSSGNIQKPTEFTADQFILAQDNLEKELEQFSELAAKDMEKYKDYLVKKKEKNDFEHAFYTKVKDILDTQIKDSNPTSEKTKKKIEELDKKIEESRKLYPFIPEPLDPTRRDFKKVQFYEDLDKLISQMKNFKEQIKKEKEKNGSHNSNINTLFSLAKDLMDSYERLRQNDRVKLRGITDNFRIKLSKIVEEFKKLNVLEKIKTDYMSRGEINTKLEGEDPDVVAELKKDYSRLIEFIDKSKDLLEPKRESSNFDLQQTIVDYSENSKDSEKDVLVFKELMDTVRTEMVFLRKDKTTDDKDKKLMRVGVCGVDKNKMDKPHYEVYVAIDVMEGEINANNLEGVKCKYRGLYLGRETENFFTKYNKFEVKQHRVYVPEKDEDERLPDEKEEEKVEEKDMVKEKEKEKEKDVVPEEKKKVNGGVKRTEPKSGSRKLFKTQSKRRSRSRRSIQ